MSEIRVLVSKTLQEAQYEPFHLELEYKGTCAPDSRIRERYDMIYKNLTKILEEKILERASMLDQAPVERASLKRDTL